MSATELFLSDGKSSGVFYCPDCRIVHRSAEFAETCCHPKCTRCGGPRDRTSLICDACTPLWRAEKEAEKFAKAEKVKSWDGWVFSEGLGYNDGFAESLEELLEDVTPGEEPEFVWTCDPNFFAHGDASDIIERILDNAYENFEASDLNGVPELKAAIEAFNKANEKICSWEPNYNRVLLIDKAAWRDA